MNNERLDWFRARVGKTVYRKHISIKQEDIKEIRIGNYLTGPKGDFAVTDINDKTKEVGSIRYVHQIEVVEPIPLSDKWMLRLGISKSEFGNTQYWFFKQFMITMEGVLFINTNMRLTKGSLPIWQRIADVKFIHQVQNVVFYPSQYELKIRDQERFQWFINRVGSSVYVKDISGIDSTLKFYVADEECIDHLLKVERVHKILHFDTPEEVIEHEKQLKK